LVSSAGRDSPGNRESRAGVKPDEIVDLFVHLEAYAGAARAFDSYQIALAVFAEQAQPS
jgi:alkylhydroperoxidase/carboxymuconolactone decarboxylase family protein YurZ